MGPRIQIKYYYIRKVIVPFISCCTVKCMFSFDTKFFNISRVCQSGVHMRWDRNILFHGHEQADPFVT